MPASIQIPLIAQSLDAPGSHVTEVDDLMFPFEVIRQNDNGDRIGITIEARCTAEGSRYYGLVTELTLLPMGLAIQADAVLFLTDAEQHAINCSAPYQDWLKEGFEAGQEARQDQAERARDFIREGRALGLIRSF